MTPPRSFTTRLSLALALLLLAYGAFVALLGRQQVASEQAQESLQRLSHGLAGHIVSHWPEITSANRDDADRAARGALLSMMMTVNPGVQVYLLDADGRVQHHIGEPGMVRQPQVDPASVRAFLAGAPLPLRGTAPMGSNLPRIFSAAMFPVRPGDSRPPGYLHVILDTQARDAVAAQVGAERVWRSAGLAAAIGLLVTLGLGLFAFRRLSLPLHRLAQRLRSCQQRSVVTAGPLAQAKPQPAAGDEVQAIGAAFDDLTQRIEAHAEREQRQVADHRELMASVAHDLRTQPTALHGHLEALAADAVPDTQRRSAAAPCCRPPWRRAARSAGCRSSCSSWRRCSPPSRCCTASASAWTRW